MLFGSGLTPDCTVQLGDIFPRLVKLKKLSLYDNEILRYIGREIPAYVNHERDPFPKVLKGQ